MAFIVDQLSPSGMHATRDALRKLINEDLRAGDLVAVVRARGGMGILQQFTSDRRVLEAAIDELKYSPGLWGGSPYYSGGFSGLRGGGYCGDDDFERWDRPRETGALSAIHFVLEGMRELPGRKSVVVFSEGLSLYENTDILGRPSVADPQIIDAVRKVTDLANRGSVVLYTVDPGGVRPSGSMSAARSGMPRWSTGFPRAASNDLHTQVAGSPYNYGDAMRCESAERMNAHSGLEILARQTGGRFFPDQNRVSHAVGQVLEDQKGYYVLGYVPGEDTFKRSKEGGPLFHNLKVRVKREGLRVRSRAGFIGVTDEDDVRPAPEKREDRLLRVMASPFTANDIPVRLTTVYGHDPAQGYVFHSMVHVDARHLTFAPREGGGHDIKLEVAAAAFANNGVLAHGGHHDISFHVTDGSLERIQRTGVVLEIRTPVKKPGPYQFRVGLRDPMAATTGTANQFVHVPDLHKDRLALSGVVLGGAPLAASPADTASAVTVAVDEPDMSPAVRRFRPGSEVTYGFAVYHTETDRQSGKPQLATELRLVRNGQDVHKEDAGRAATLTALPAPPAKTKIKKVPGYVVAGKFRLPESLEPGEYALQLMVTDELTKKKTRTSGQWTGLEVVAETKRTSALW